MQKRHFENWLEAYEEYTNDAFVPPQFNTWVGLSVLAGALERKVWLPWSETFSYYPNIFVLLVSLPGVGKSTALNKGVGLLQELVQRGSNMNVLPSQVTEAKFISMMGEQFPFEYGSKMIMQSAGYYFASEASNALKNIFGDFIACLTDFYDCPVFWEKATQKDDKITLRNVCLNLLAGSTFDYLGKLVTDDNIMGGFASRLVYVVQREKLVRTQKFQHGGANLAQAKDREEFRRKLIEDLQLIHKMVGPFSANQEFGAAWEAWYPKFEEKRQSNPSEKMQSLLVRTNTNVLKISMLMSAACGDDRILKLPHWERALALAETNEKELPAIFREAKSNDTKSQDGLIQAIFRAFEAQPHQNIDILKKNLNMKGFDANRLDSTFRMMEKGGAFDTVSVSGSGRIVKLLTNTNQYI